jgi:transcriptional regulator with XRE-family HTH domain
MSDRRPSSSAQANVATSSSVRARVPLNKGPRERVPELVSRIGAHIREVRTEKHLTLEQVASASQLTKGFISVLERGDSSVSLASLIRICSVLDIDLASLFEGSAATAGPLVRREDRQPNYLGGEGVLDYLLTRPSEPRIEVFETHLEPGGTPGEELFSLDSELAFALVLRGSLEVRFEDRTLTMRTGDALTYSPREPHTFSNPSRTREAVFVHVRCLKAYLP